MARCQFCNQNFVQIDMHEPRCDENPSNQGPEIEIVDEIPTIQGKDKYGRVCEVSECCGVRLRNEENVDENGDVKERWLVCRGCHKKTKEI